ncbi:MAG: diphthamide biosynthesis enzyme Dph2 [archaeon]
MYCFDTNQVIARLKRRSVKRIAIQLPAGLRTRAVEIAKSFADNGFEARINVDPCFGACDICDPLDAEAIVHFGHTDYDARSRVPVLYVPVENDADPAPLIKQAIPKLTGKTVCLLSTAQHLRSINEITSLLKSAGKEVVLGRGKKSAVPGQVLGCDFDALVDADAYLFYGTGNFHPIGIAMRSGQDVIVADPETNTVRTTGELKRKLLTKRHAAIEKSRQAKVFGVLVSTKPGQKNLFLARKLIQLIEKNNKQGLLVYGNNLSPDALAGLKVDVFVSTACPRIAIDDYTNYAPKPVLNPVELEVLFGKVKWEDYESHYP